MLTEPKAKIDLGCSGFYKVASRLEAITGMYIMQTNLTYYDCYALRRCDQSADDGIDKLHVNACMTHYVHNPSHQNTTMRKTIDKVKMYNLCLFQFSLGFSLTNEDLFFLMFCA